MITLPYNVINVNKSWMWFTIDIYYWHPKITNCIVNVKSQCSSLRPETTTTEVMMIES